MHVNPITHNGEFSIGYDANALTGVWCWQDPDGRIYDPEAILEQHGDR